MLQAPDSEVFFQVELGFRVAQAIDSFSKRVWAFSEGCQFLSLCQEVGAALGLPSPNVGNQTTNEKKTLNHHYTLPAFQYEEMTPTALM
jgi:hypothetical protein